MTIEINDIIRLTVFAEMFGESIQNVFWYRCDNVISTAGLSDVAVAFNQDVLTDWRDVVSEDMVFTRTLVENMTDGINFDDVSFSLAGLVLSPSASSAIAAAVKLNVATRITRPGSKRISGIPESRVNDNVFDSVTGTWNVFEASLGNSIGYTLVPPPGQINLSPIVVGRDPITGLPDLGRVSGITNAATRSTITTQTSRRPGRGI